MFGKLFGGKGGDRDGDKSAGGPPDNPRMIHDDDPRIQQGYDRLKTYWNRIGPSDSDVISYIINPQFEGKPGWPNMRQAYRVVRPDNSLIIASDGLADPFVNTDMDDAQGLGCEVYIEAPEFAGADFNTLRASWAFSLIENFAMNVAQWGGLSRQLASHGVLSLELPAEGILPDAWLAPSGNVGCLVGLPAPGRKHRIDDMPFGPVDIISLTIIKPVELERIISGGAEARRQLAKELAATGVHHISRLDRL